MRTGNDKLRIEVGDVMKHYKGVKSIPNARKGVKGFMKLSVHRSSVVTVRLVDEEFEALNDLCDKFNLNKGEVIRLALKRLSEQV